MFGIDIPNFWTEDFKQLNYGIPDLFSQGKIACIYELASISWHSRSKRHLCWSFSDENRETVCSYSRQLMIFTNIGPLRGTLVFLRSISHYWWHLRDSVRCKNQVGVSFLSSPQYDYAKDNNKTMSLFELKNN